MTRKNRTKNQSCKHFLPLPRPAKPVFTTIISDPLLSILKWSEVKEGNIHYLKVSGENEFKDF